MSCNWQVGPGERSSACQINTLIQAIWSSYYSKQVSRELCPLCGDTIVLYLRSYSASPIPTCNIYQTFITHILPHGFHVCARVHAHTVKHTCNRTMYASHGLFTNKYTYKCMHVHMYKFYPYVHMFTFTHTYTCLFTHMHHIMYTCLRSQFAPIHRDTFYNLEAS